MNNIITKTELTSVPKIKLLWMDGYSEIHIVGSNIRGVSHNGKRPVDLEWYNAEGVMPTVEHLNWINRELVYVFDPEVKFKNRIYR